MSAPNDKEHLLVPARIDEPLVLQLTNEDVLHHTTEGGEVLAVFVGRTGSFQEGRLPVAGRYQREGEFLRFTPAFGFAAGQDYVVRTRRKGEPYRLTEFTIPPEDAPKRALVTNVFPTAEVLPENVLRFYLHFSVPMAPHCASDFVKLRDALGVADDAAFMKFKQELWNEDRTRLTVLMDPGRIKRNVATNLDLGPALLEGNHYAVTVDAGWPSADGSSALPGYSKSFKVGSALRERPDVQLWKWRLPRAGTRESLEVQFDRPFDRHRLSGSLSVATKDGRLIGGRPHVGESETSWCFIPSEAWIAGEVRITVDGLLEDVAGNNFHDLLDRDVSAPDPGSVLAAELRVC